ncbi:MAG: flagellar protein FlaG [Synergistaceae bacterium]|nr:flagellar protein FlaG [Synergistaceae bacterium]
MEIKLPRGRTSSYVSTSRYRASAGQGSPLSSSANVPDAVEAVGKIQESPEKNTPLPDQETQRAIMKRTSELVSMLDRNLKFEVHEDVGIVQVHVIDSTDGRIVRKVPADEVLKLVAFIREIMSERVDVKV